MAKYSKAFKEEAIRLSDEVGSKKAAAQLGLPYYTLADWRNHSKHKPKGPELSDAELKIRNRELEAENEELRRDMLRGTQAGLSSPLAGPPGAKLHFPRYNFAKNY